MKSEYRGLLIVLSVLVLIVLLMPMLGVGMMGPGMMGGFGAQSGGWPWGWGLAMGLGMLVMLAFWGALIVGVVLLVRWLLSATGSPGSQPSEAPLEILKRRYAAGDITQEEYLQLRRELES